MNSLNKSNKARKSILLNVLFKVFFLSFIFLQVNSNAQDSIPISLLDKAKQISDQDQQLNAQRLTTFKKNQAEQIALLQKSRERLKQSQAVQAQLKTLFDQNDNQLAELENSLQKRSGQLGEVFGVAKEAAGELQIQLSDTITSAQYKDRLTSLDFSHSKRIPELSDLHRLWYLLQQEMLASAQITKFKGDVVTENGNIIATDIVRFGSLSAATTAGDFLLWHGESQQLQQLLKQPDNRYKNNLLGYLQGDETPVLIDPSRGQLLSLLAQKPTIIERMQQGGNVGYVIIALGFIGLIIAIWNSFGIYLTKKSLDKQLANLTQLQNNNPLGRVLHKLKHTDNIEENKAQILHEALLHESPNLVKGQSSLKLLTGVCPLLGLLGTVMGMIVTFQSITLYGSNDPKLMAGGISQALTTTVLGLLAAIPLMFFHSYLVNRSHNIIQIIQHKSLAFLNKSQVK